MKRKTHSGNGLRSGFDPARFPALRQFLSGYLHQDFAEEYPSAADAAKTFLSEASAAEIGAVREECARFHAALNDRPLGEIQAALARLGAAWYPQSKAEWSAVEQILSGTQA
ncbi:MAG TPA: contact-dependent growth inhibition system immunity protein [Candidatus Acidoferrum sp.]